MAIVQTLYVVAFRQLIRVAAETVGPGVVGYVLNHFAQHGQQLAAALQLANDRAWRTLEAALIGQLFWDFLHPAEEEALAEQVRIFLEKSQLRSFSDSHADFRKKCLMELIDVRCAGLSAAPYHHLNS